MLNKKIFTVNSLLTVLLCVLFLYWSNTIIGESSAEISISSYCQLTIDSMQQEVLHYQQRIALVNQYGDDADTLAEQEDIKRAEFDQARGALYSSYATTADEYVLYMGEHKKEVDKYLKDNSDIKQQIDDLATQVNSLMEQYESLRGSSEPPEPPL